MKKLDFVFEYSSNFFKNKKGFCFARSQSNLFGNWKSERCSRQKWTHNSACFSSSSECRLGGGDLRFRFGLYHSFLNFYKPFLRKLWFVSGRWRPAFLTRRRRFGNSDRPFEWFVVCQFRKPASKCPHVFPVDLPLFVLHTGRRFACFQRSESC